MNRDSRSTTGKTPGVALSIVMLFAFLGVVFAVAFAGAAVTTANLSDWYNSIAKPELTPANWVFPIVWNLLFLMMGIAGWLVWRAAGGLNEAGGVLSIFAAQLMLNFAWSVLFFGLHRPDLALAEVIVLDLAITATIVGFWWHSKLAALLLVPYLLWTLFATWLTAAIWLLNK